jgi:rfaE bifunctional protein nucleotidyltransferase chain/domain
MFRFAPPGRVELLKRSRAACDRLVVALNTDASVRRLKGETRPVQNEHARSIVMAAIDSVDLVTLFDDETPLRLIEALKPDYLIKGADYTVATVVGSEFVASYGGKTILVPIEQGHSRPLKIVGANDASRLRGDPLFKMAMELTPSDRQLSSQSTISRLENLPDVRALLRMGRAMVDLYCTSFREVPKRITLGVDDTFDAVHGGRRSRGSCRSRRRGPCLEARRAIPRSQCPASPPERRGSCPCAPRSGPTCDRRPLAEREPRPARVRAHANGSRSPR